MDISRRLFAGWAAGAMLGSTVLANEQGDGAKNDAPKSESPKSDPPKEAPRSGPVEAPFERDYTPPSFKPSWKNPQINRLLVQDFVIYSHTDPEMVKKLLDKEPGLVVSIVNWGAGDWESGLGTASHMGRRDIVDMLLERGARVDIFCAAMLGLLDVVKAFITLQPKLIDAKGPHGFSLHFHAQVGGKPAEPVLEYLQSVKKIELKEIPFLKKKPEEKKDEKTEEKKG